MCLQDIPINSSTKACVMFDNGSELTLVSSYFTKKNNLSYEDTIYTLVGEGGAETFYNTREGGKIYTMPLMSSSGEIVSVKALSVNNINTNKVGREQINLNPKEFTHLSQDVLKETVNYLPIWMS